MELRDYEAIKFHLASIIRSIAERDEKKDEEFERKWRSLCARLAEDRFNLVVAGRFNRGKSSLMNAILGMNRLPTGLIPLTSVITRVVYGSSQQVQIDFLRGGLPATVAIEQLPEFVTERGNPGNIKGIEQARIELPAEILRRGFHFIDTPGLGSTIIENTRTTQAFLPEADAVLLVSDYESALTDDELRLMQQLHTGHRRVFLIINKQDLVSEQAREESMDFVKSQLTRTFGAHPPSIHSISARDGLMAKEAHDSTLLARSGIAALEQALVDFLTEEQRTLFLLGLIDRAEALFEWHVPSKESPPALKQLEELRERITGQPSLGKARTMYQATSEDLQVGECSVCVQVLDACFEFLRHYQYALVSSAAEQERFSQRGGFCEQHLWLYSSLASTRGLSLAVAPLLQRMGRSLLDEIGKPSAAWLERIDCELCLVQSKTERQAFVLLARIETSHDGNDTRAEALCLPHLRRLTHYARENDILLLVRRTGMAAERLAEDALRYVLKRDGLRRGLTSDEEENAGQLSIAFLAGHSKVKPCNYSEETAGAARLAPAGDLTCTLSAKVRP